MKLYFPRSSWSAPPDGFTRSDNESEIIGKTPVSVWDDDCEIHMKFSDGSYCRWHHEQDCCESVGIEDINGDLSDLIGHPLLVVDVRTNKSESRHGDSETWTFYTLRSIGGSVDIRWHGESNGYYSESVDFELLTPTT